MSLCKATGDVGAASLLRAPRGAPHGGRDPEPEEEQEKVTWRWQQPRGFGGEQLLECGLAAEGLETVGWDFS